MQQQTGHTLKAFDEDIDRLRGLISEMGQLAQQAIIEAMRCLVERDTEAQQKLATLGWKVLTIWECETRATGGLVAKLTTIVTMKHALHAKIAVQKFCAISLGYVK